MDLTGGIDLGNRTVDRTVILIVIWKYEVDLVVRYHSRGLRSISIVDYEIYIRTPSDHVDRLTSFVLVIDFCHVQEFARFSDLLG